MFRMIFIVGCVILLLVCVAGMFGFIHMPEEFYIIFWIGFFILMAIGKIIFRFLYWLKIRDMMR